MLSEFASNVLADVSNIGLHFLQPFRKHQHSCACLLCSAHEHDDISQHQQSRMSLLIPLATPSDLDLVKTGSKSIRQLVVLSNAVVQALQLRPFCSQLKTHLNYAVSYVLPKINSSTPYHVLVFVLCDDEHTSHAHAWFTKVIAKHTKRAVVICSTRMAAKFGGLDAAKVTLLAYQDLNVTLQALTHGMMVTKQRLMPKDLPRFLPKLTQTTPHQLPQPGMCLFL